jgi:hypothetical protein
MIKLLQFVMILPILVVDLELRAALFHQGPLGRIELGDGLETVRAVIVGAFVDGYFLLNFPAEERQSAMGTEELRFSVVPEAVPDLEEKAANLASDLRAFLAVVEVEIIVGCLAAEADHLFRYPWGIAMRLNWSKRLSVNRFVVG